MSHLKIFHTLWITLALFAANGLSAASLRAEIGSRIIVEGEQTILEFALSDTNDPGGNLKFRKVNGLQISLIEVAPGPRDTFGRRGGNVFRYGVTTYTPGVYTIPAATIELADQTLRSEPIQLRVIKETELQWSTVRSGGRDIRYAAAFHTIDDQPFVNEVIPTELKLYLPRDLRIDDWGIPELKRDGVAAWRIEPQSPLGRVRLLGKNYYAVSYPGSLSPTRAGPVQLGPADLRLISVHRSIENFGERFHEPIHLAIPALEINARALPDGAPDGFEDAIGRFELNVTARETEVREGDPVSINILVRGRGNLNTLNVPRPIDDEGVWKLYPASPGQRSNRRSISGYMAFRQFMRPLRPQDQIPPFRLVYFDPEQETYVTLLSSAIPLKVMPSSGPATIGSSVPPQMPIPVERMSDILAITKGGRALLPESRLLPSWAWQVVPAGLAVLLLIAIFRKQVAPQMRKNPDELARLRDLKTLDQAPSELKEFYRASGHFVERWLGDSDDPLPREVVAKRDQTCFKEGVPDETISRSERQRILRKLRKLALPLVTFFLLLGNGELQAREGADTAEIAYEESRYSDAARMWLESGPYERLSADTLYNIGNAAYRLGSPGEAALYWRRALIRDETHAEARQNLRFFERKFGSIVVKRPDYQHVLATLSLDTWKNFVWGAAWISGIAVLIFPATHSAARLRIAAIGALVATPLIAAVGIFGWYYYPDDAHFELPSKQAVIVSDKASIRTDASRNAPLVIEAPAGSLCRVLSRSGNWVYLAFSNETRGWVPAAEIENIIPHSQPTVPELRKSDDEGKSA